MKKIIVIALIAMLVSCGSVMAGAPSSGDGDSVGSGWEEFPPQDGPVTTLLSPTATQITKTGTVPMILSDMAKPNLYGICQYTTLAKGCLLERIIIKIFCVAAGDSNVGTVPNTSSIKI